MITDNYWLAHCFVMLVLLLAYEFIYKRLTFYNLNRFYLVGTVLASVLLPLITIDAIPYLVEVATTPQVISSSNIDGTMPIDTSYTIWYTYIYGVFISLTALLFRTYNTWKAIVLAQRHPQYRGPAMSFFNYVVVPLDSPPAISLHEDYHKRSGHSYDRLLVAIVHCFFWYNPLFFILTRRLIDNHEFAADRYVLGNQPETDQLSYAQLLVASATLTNRISFANQFASSIIKRLNMINQTKTSTALPYLSIVPIILIIFSTTSLKRYPVYTIDSLMVGDTLPQLTVEVDTNMTFDAESLKETVEIVESVNSEMLEFLASIDYSGKEISVTDTIITLDYDTYEESVDIVAYSYPVEIADLLNTVPPSHQQLIIQHAKKLMSK